MSKPTNATLSDTSWFPHDLDSSNDPKLAALLDDHGAAGYGIFWHVVELLHAEPDGYLPLKKYVFKAVAKNLKTTAEVVEKVIRDGISEYDLFVELEEKFTAERVQSNLKRRAQNKETHQSNGAKGGKASAEARAKGKQGSSQAQAPLKPNSSESNQRRGEEINISPLISNLKIALGGTPTIESLGKAFSSSYPRPLSDGEKLRIDEIFTSFELESAKKIVELVISDLESTNGKAGFFDNVIKYLTDNAEGL